MARLNFAAQVDAWAKQTQQRMEAVFRTSAQKVIENVIELTPVDTGFLRASLTVTTGAMPTINRSAQPAEGAKYEPQPYALAIAGAQLGQTISAGFVASYAAHVEYGANGRAGRGMVRLAAQNWPQHVAEATREVKGGRT